MFRPECKTYWDIVAKSEAVFLTQKLADRLRDYAVAAFPIIIFLLVVPWVVSCTLRREKRRILEIISHAPGKNR
jgi:hypothetical protein